MNGACAVASVLVTRPVAESDSARRHRVDATDARRRERHGTAAPRERLQLACTPYRLVVVINTKTCSLSIVLTATDQKPQKSL